MRGLLAFAATFFVMAFLLPVLLAYFFGASSSLCLEPSPPNQINSIQIFPKVEGRFFSHYFSSDGTPSSIRVHINPYFSPDKASVLSINLQTKQMQINEDCGCETNSRNLLVPFCAESLTNLLTTYKAPHSPQQGTVNSAEVYQVLKTVSEIDIRDYKTISETPLKNFKFSYIFPEKGNPNFGLCILISLSFGFSFANKKPKGRFKPTNL
jgi:hypothetical protein